LAAAVETSSSSVLATVLPQINTASLKDPNYLRQIRSLYVGNLPPNISREHLIDFVNSVAIETGLTPVPVCFTAQCHLEKYYAFCEFTSPEACTKVFFEECFNVYIFRFWSWMDGR
jgi:RNA recognition motif-containing protein